MNEVLIGPDTDLPRTRGMADLGMALLSQWLVIGAAIAAAILLAVLYLHVATYKYSAEIVVTPAQPTNSAIGRLGNVAGLASIAGLNIPQDQGTLQFQLYTEGLRSRALAEELARDETVMRRVFADEWDAAQNQWVAPQSTVKAIINAIKTIVGAPVVPWRQPDGARLQEFIGKKLYVVPNQKNPIVIVGVTDPDPAFAVWLLSNLHETLDQMLRTKALDRSTSHIAYLSRQLETTTNAEQRVALAQALIEQERIRMQASSRQSFAAEPFGAAAPSPKPVSPSPAVTLVLSALVGLIVGLAVAFMRVEWLERRAKQRILAA